jgi:hypothetical protein
MLLSIEGTFGHSHANLPSFQTKGKSAIIPTKELYAGNACSSKPPLICKAYETNKPQIKGCHWEEAFPLSNQLSIDYDYQCWAGMSFTLIYFMCIIEL